MSGLLELTPSNRRPGRSGAAPRSASTRALAAVALVMLVGLVGAACSSGHDAPTELTEVQTRLDAAGIECGDITPYTAPESAADLGVEPVRTFRCSVDDLQVQGTEYGSAEDREKALEVSTDLVCSVGGSLFSYVANDAWMVTAENPQTRTSNLELLERVGEATDSDVSTIECPEGAGSIHDTMNQGSTTTAAP